MDPVEGVELPPAEQPSDTGVSPAALDTATRIDNVAEKIIAAMGPVIEGESSLDVVAALDLVKARVQHLQNVQTDAAQLGG